MTYPKSKLELLERWHKRLREVQASHYEAAKPLASMNLRLGIPVVILTAIVGTSVFASLEKEVHLAIKITVGLISVTAAVLSSLQTFLRFSERAEMHRTVGAKAGAVRREIEQALASGDVNNLSDEKVNRIRELVDEISNIAPSVPDKIWKRVEKQLQQPG